MIIHVSLIKSKWIIRKTMPVIDTHINMYIKNSNFIQTTSHAFAKEQGAEKQ